MAWEQLAPVYINRLSKDLDLTPQQAAGVIGQLGYESDGLQSINERNPAVPGSRGGFGWAQWTGPRRQTFESWASENKADPSDPETNYQFLLHELKDTPEGRVLDAVRGSDDAVSAGRAFTDGFLRPGVPAYANRDSWVQKALNFVVPAAQAGTLPKEMSLQDRIQKARDAGFNDEEILSRIQSNADMAARIQKARDAGFTDEEIFGRMGLPATKPEAQKAPEKQPDEPGMLDRIGRQVGLTARYGLEGLGQVADIFTEPIRQSVVNPAARALSLPQVTETTGQLANHGADALGLPKPQGALENVVGDVTRLMAGAGGLAGTAGALSRGATGAAQAALQGLAANPAQQIVSAGGAGATGGAAREAGAPAPVQLAAALAGGLAAPMAVNRGMALAQGLNNRISAMRPGQVLERVKASLAQNGVEWNQIPSRIQQQLLEEAKGALRTGDLSPQALSRLADFQQVQGATPTRGMLTQDPNIVTREQNLAKMQAQLGPGGLPEIQNQNNAALVRALNEFNPADQATAGQGALNALQGRLSAQRANIGNLYSQARDSAGRSFPLDGAAFTQRAGQLLDDNLIAGSLPADVRNHLNQIAQGRVPFTVDYAEQLKTLMGRLQRNSSDGNARYALGLVRQALEETPILGLGEQTAAAGARAVNPGNLPAIPGDPNLGEQAVEAFTRARGANRAMMRQIENTPALQALEAGSLPPERFVQRFITSPSASNTDVRRLGRLLAANPQARESVRSGIAQYLKDKALSGKPDDIGAAKFSADQYAKALEALGDSKLSAFFDRAEIQQLHALSRAARLMVNQPVGSAVNNSNTAAAVLGRALDMMGGVGRGFKILGIGDQIKAIEAALGQRKALNARGALTLPAPRRPAGAIPAAVYGSALAAVPPSKDDGSQ